jgi:hypothetical protein
LQFPDQLFGCKLSCRLGRAVIWRDDAKNLVAADLGHTTYGYMGVLVLAILVPERYQQMMARGAKYGNDRILMGVCAENPIRVDEVAESPKLAE